MNSGHETNIKRLIWLYFLLLIFEGALRKWILPGLSTPLLVIRAPLVMVIYVYAMTVGKFPLNGWIFSLFAISLASLAAGFVVASQNVFVAAFGWQTNFLHLPLIFVMGSLMDAEDVRKFGKWVLLLALPMGALVALQFLAAPGSFLNRGAEEGAKQIVSAGGRIRPAGTFSYNQGIAYLYSLVTALVLYRLTTNRSYSLFIVAAAGFATLLVAACSGSRNFLAQCSVVILSLFAVMFLRPGLAGGITKVLIGGAAAVAILGSLNFVREGVSVMETRISNASKSEGGAAGFAQRITERFTKGIVAAVDTPIFGHGLGVGTNVGAVMLRGQRTFILAEDEWERVVMESGPLLGPVFLIWRLALVIWLAFHSIRFAKRGHILPILILAGMSPIIVQGQFGQATVVGFAVIGGGLCLASMNIPESKRVTAMEGSSSDPPEQLDEPPVNPEQCGTMHW